LHIVYPTPRCLATREIYNDTEGLNIPSSPVPGSPPTNPPSSDKFTNAAGWIYQKDNYPSQIHHGGLGEKCTWKIYGGFNLTPDDVNTPPGEVGWGEWFWHDEIPPWPSVSDYPKYTYALMPTGFPGSGFGFKQFDWGSSFKWSPSLQYVNGISEPRFYADLELNCGQSITIGVRIQAYPHGDYGGWMVTYMTFSCFKNWKKPEPPSF
jgi:hypothetical protein